MANWITVRNKYTKQVQEMVPAVARDLVAQGAWEFVKEQPKTTPIIATAETAAIASPVRDFVERVMRPMFSRGPRSRA